MTTDLEKIMNDYISSWNSHDVERMLSFFVDDAVYEDTTLGMVNRGKKQIKDFFIRTFAEFPDFKVDMKSSFNTLDRGAVEWVMNGTFAQSYMPGVTATGKTFSVRGASVTELRNNKISRQSDYWNMAMFLQQVGLVPGPEK